MNKNQKIALWVVGGVVVVGGIASAGNDDSDKAPVKAKPAVTHSAAPKPKPSKVAPVKFDKPSPAEEKQLLSKLKAINPGITVNEERAVRRAVNTCQEIQAGDSPQTLIKNTSYRFTGGNATVNEDQALQIIKAVKGTFCG
ncbi:DUF732 domain-containing protein [Streptomyces sp. NPDC001422]|uniref:DUF732 domain-containing protein n=1 Tax=Streptomyces sp. NPDC001422 TaxID=3364575 RepID=UPI0036A60DCD